MLWRLLSNVVDWQYYFKFLYKFAPFSSDNKGYYAKIFF